MNLLGLVLFCLLIHNPYILSCLSKNVSAIFGMGVSIGSSAQDSNIYNNTSIKY